MTLANPNPVIKEATEAKTFDSLWLSNITIHAPSTTAGRICVETLPFNGETGEIGSGEDMVPIETVALWEAVAEVPELGLAMQAIFNAIEPLREWEAARIAALAEAES